MAYEEKMTNAQLAAMEIFKELPVEALLVAGAAAVNAIVDLPSKNERGEPVVQGCNQEMRHMATACRYALIALQDSGKYDFRSDARFQIIRKGK